MEWSNDVTLEFLGLYENEPCIWNPRHPLHKSRNDVYDAWKRIEEAMSVVCTVEQLKKKKDSLMASFRFLCNKAKANSSKSTDGIVAKPSWFAFRRMETFLKDVYQPRNNALSPAEDFVENNSSTIEVYHHNIKEELEESREEYVVEPNCGTVIIPDEIPETTVPNLRTKVFSRNVIEKRKRNTLLGMKKRVAVAKRTCSATETPARKDDCSLYAELLARKLRALNEKTREIVMNDIDNLVFRAKMDQSYQPRNWSSAPTYQRQYAPPAPSCSQPSPETSSHPSLESSRH